MYHKNIFMQAKGEVWVPYVGGFSNTGGQADPQKELFGGTNFTYYLGNFWKIYIKGGPSLVSPVFLGK
jgi:hypothetical protein